MKDQKSGKTTHMPNYNQFHAQLTRHKTLCKFTHQLRI